MRRPLRSAEARSVANLAIDLGDPGRMAKARRLHRGNSVGTVDIYHQAAEATVADPSGELMDVTITIDSPAQPGTAPLANTVTTTCGCDDDSTVCMHALAAVLGVAEEIEANGRLLAIWGGTEGPGPDLSSPKRPEGADAFFSGAWTGAPPVSPLEPLKLGDDPVLAVDGVDAGPVLIEARGAIQRGLSRYRARS